MLPGAGQTFRGQRVEGEPACHHFDATSACCASACLSTNGLAMAVFEQMYSGDVFLPGDREQEVTLL